MKFAKDKGIIGAFTPNTDDWKKAIEGILRNANEFIYIE